MVISIVLDDRPAVLERFGPDIKLSFNVTAKSVVDPEFLQFCIQMDNKYGFKGKNLCLEVTEQSYLAFDDTTIKALEALRNTGLLLAIDDFSMGQTSIHYIKDNLFDIIKLDGSLIQELFSHKNNREIISSIVQLTSTLNMSVIAEFVETEQQRDTLYELGCDIYQGHLYSPAIFL